VNSEAPRKKGGVSRLFLLAAAMSLARAGYRDDARAVFVAAEAFEGPGPDRGRAPGAVQNVELGNPL